MYWSEMLYRAHMAAATALLRADRWLHGAMSALDPANVLSHTANLRGLLEASADTSHSLSAVPGTLARDHAEIRRALAGGQDKFLVNGDLEDMLIHFTHGRKLGRGETAPESHRALCSRDYLDSLRQAVRAAAEDPAAPDRLADLIGECYRRLCEMVHPGALSVHVFLQAETEDSPECALAPNDVGRIGWLWSEYGEVISEACQFGINTPLLILGVLNSFDLAPVRTPGLESRHLQHIRGWRKLAEQLRG
ncbi:MAG: hypothetical protein HY320_02365 [Armatimonadetes bacterium]|nr:hypothetical protein [Armatimonadota bacterium]